jgi:hypothetical protein
MNTRPSGSTHIPLQNMSQASVCDAKVFATGSQTTARKFVSVATLPEPATTSTLPSFVSARCTGLIGITLGSVRH